MEKNTFNNYLRVKNTSNHKNRDINRFSGPKNIRKTLLLGDLEKNKKSKMAGATTVTELMDLTQLLESIYGPSMICGARNIRSGLA